MQLSEVGLSYDSNASCAWLPSFDGPKEQLSILSYLWKVPQLLELLQI